MIEPLNSWKRTPSSWLTFNKDGRKLSCDVLSDSQSVPGVDGPIGEHYPAGADVIATVVLVGLGHSFCHLLSTDVVESCTLFHLITAFNSGKYKKLKRSSVWEIPPYFFRLQCVLQASIWMTNTSKCIMVSRKEEDACLFVFLDSKKVLMKQYWFHVILNSAAGQTRLFWVIRNQTGSF